MKRVIFVDSFYWIALANETDQWHQAAELISPSVQDAHRVTTELVLSEVLTHFAE